MPQADDARRTKKKDRMMRRIPMAKKAISFNHARLSAQPRLHQRAREIQEYGTVTHALPLDRPFTSFICSSTSTTASRWNWWTCLWLKQKPDSGLASG